MENTGPSLLAFYLPQFHPIPENDKWWGPGHTEWRTVARGKPLFKGHYQPHEPADLAYYDLRLPQTRLAQADLAKRYGLTGFCYYHYWFHGYQVLQEPLQQVLDSGEPDFPFCICWANESWGRSWSNDLKTELLTQSYSAQDDKDHFMALLPYFQDPRYIRVEGKPLFLVYRAEQIPHVGEFSDRWNSLAKENSLPGIYFVLVESTDDNLIVPASIGFDAAVEFAPNWSRKGWNRAPYLTRYKKFQYELYWYEEMLNNMLSRPVPNYTRFPGVTPMWDNAARRKNYPNIFHGSTPALYKKWLKEAIRRTCQQNKPAEQFVFINAWNEWSEGCHLEPCVRYGHQYLEATLAALEESGAMNGPSGLEPGRSTLP